MHVYCLFDSSKLRNCRVWCHGAVPARHDKIMGYFMSLEIVAPKSVKSV